MNFKLGLVQTDLAVEAREAITRDVHEDIPGVRVETDEDEDIKVTKVVITTEQAAQMMHKSRGNYVTVEAPGLRYKNTILQDRVMNKLAEEMVKLANLPQDATVLVVGLGNWNITPDALGPRVTEKIVVTRHLQQVLSPELKGRVRSVCAIAPGVLGLTGMETSEIISGIVGKIKPNLVVCVDALAAASSSRVTTTVQLTDTGISPGAGVGNKRSGITKEFLGVPVIAVGVPTVVHASTIANDTVETLMQHAHFARYFKSLQDLNEQDKHTIIRQVLPETMGDLMVTPKEVDTLIADISSVVAGGLNQALHPSIDYNNIHMYLNFN